MRIDTNARILFFSTVRIIGSSSEDDTFYTEGTGFVFDMSRTPGRHAPVLVTARHVIEGATTLEFRILLRKSDGTPDFGSYRDVTIQGGAAQFTTHPDPRIDIAVFPLATMFDAMNIANLLPLVSSFRPEEYPTAHDLETIDAVEEVVFVGYPDGQFDRANHTPVARRGITATPVQLDWSGAPQFLVDGHIFEGSSGSPVAILRPATVATPRGLAFSGPRLIFLGVLTTSIRTAAEVTRSDERRPDVDVRIGVGLGLVEKWTAVDETLDELAQKAGVDRDAIPPTQSWTIVTERAAETGSTDE